MFRDEVLRTIRTYSPYVGWEWMVVREIPGDPDAWLELGRARSKESAWENAQPMAQRWSDLMDLDEDVA